MSSKPIKLALRGIILGTMLCGMPLGFKALLAGTPHRLPNTPEYLTLWQAIILLPGIIGCIGTFLALLLGIVFVINRVWSWIWKNEQHELERH